jgi:DNA repair exonuclease SbcCD ATPase subunit
LKLNKIRVQNFRVISDTTLDTGGSKFVVLRGKNANGKTSLAEALSLGLTDTTWGLDKRGAGFAKKIKRGEPKATIEVDLQGANRLIHRTVNLHVNSLGRTQSSEDLSDPNWHPKKFDDLLALKKAALGVAINTRDFMNLVYSRDEDAQKNLLASLVLPARHEFEKDTVADVESVLGEGVIDFNGEPFAVISKAYKKLFDERASVNKKVKDFVIPVALPRPQGVDSESLKTQLSSLREARQKQSVERDAAAKKANEETLKRDRANTKIETLEAVLKASKESLRALEASILPDPSAVQEVAGRTAERERLRSETQRLSHAQEAAKAEETRLHELSKLGATCPTCDQDIDDSKLGQLMTEIIDKRAQLLEEYGKAAQALVALGDVDGAIAKLNRHKTALADKADLATRIEENVRALKEAKEEADKDKGGLFDSAAFDNALTETDRKIETILTQIQPVIAAEEREKEIATKKEQLKRLEDKAAKLDKLVRLFDKDGIKAKLIATHIGGFELKVNSVLSAWDYSCSLSIEPFKFEITDYRKVSTPLIELSGAEELMFYAAFQCAVSRTAGIGFVVIDRVDTLLPDLRPALFKNLHKMVSEGVLDQVILLIADTSEQVPKIPDSAFFVIEEGNIRRLG